MRKAFIDKLTELAAQNNDIYVITADTGFKVFDEYQKTFADRYLNIGISEAAMISVASGLALSGKNVFVYGIVPFVVMRCFEQIRNDLCMQKLPVKIIGVGGGLTYGPEGSTHHSIEDIAVMNALPNMTIICPGDPIEAAKAVEVSVDMKGPLYLRIGKSGEEIIHIKEDIPFTIGKGIVMKEGKDVAIISTGNMLKTAMELFEALKVRGMDPGLVSMHTVKPLDRELIVELSKRCQMLVSLEEHSSIGGLGSAIANVIAEENIMVTLRKYAINDQYTKVVGSQSYLRAHFGLTSEHILNDLIPALNMISEKIIS